MKKLIALFLMTAFFVSCSNQQQKQTNQENAALEITVEHFKDKAPELVGKLVSIQGTADHICSHDGKKLFLIDIDKPGRVKVVTAEELPAFNNELEGHDFLIEGLIAETIVDEAYLLNWEEQLRIEGESQSKHLDGEQGHDHGEGEDHHSADEDYAQIAKYRELMEEQGTDKLSFYHITAVSYKVLD